MSGVFGLVLALLLSLVDPGQDINLINSENTKINTIYYQEFSEQENPGIDQLIQYDGFKQKEGFAPNFGVNNDVVWIKFHVINQDNRPEQFLVMDNPTLDEIEYYLFESGELIDKGIRGRSFRDKVNDHSSSGYILPLKLETNIEYAIYLKVKSFEKKVLPMKIMPEIEVLKEVKREDVYFGVFSGIFIGLLFYNLFLYFSLRDKAYLLYVFHTVFVWLAQSSIMGYTQQILWPEWDWINSRANMLFSSAVSIVGILFLKEFLNTKKFVPKLDKGLRVFFVIYPIVVLTAIIGHQTLSYNILIFTQSIIVWYILLIGIQVNREGYRPARYYLLAWSFFMLGIFLFVIRDMGLIPYNMFSAYVMPVGSVLEVILLSLALADKINVLKVEKEEEQHKTLNAIKENERLIKEQNVILEEKVKLRTEELERTLSNLQNTQTQLVNQEKMASLGQLTAGIAHEINNPINFVSSNISPLKRDIKDIMEIVEAYREKGKTEFKEETKEELQELEEDLEFDYLIEEVALLLKGMEDGAKRTVEIVKGLRLFSRVDEQDVKKVDLHDGINSTLVLLNSTMGKIEVKKDYGNIPMVECLAGKMNQVFMNIISNAIQALGEQGSENSAPGILIKTMSQNGEVTLEIEDNGPGMPEHVRERIFEPFFTTKAVGKGTGLGLSIVYKIIENHRGKLDVFTSPGKGTKFVIKLPVYQKTPKNEQ
ncbi:sensor histidine kinase [Echinicola shivajiensis]|uniref:sensor histidine kinase n=1 Tax=Echinicola shivajiensis TaxID=1035916 RepID=UPI001FEAAC67|nr:7TM diverse intracellular signaling domain-containing protein [Echinicola shivajiensis]